jgi:hypothetical protein
MIATLAAVVIVALLLTFLGWLAAFTVCQSLPPRRRPADVEAVENCYQASGYAPGKTQR